MGVGAAVAEGGRTSNFAHLLNPNRKWYNNRRLITLHAWLVLLLITSSGNGFDGSLMNSFQSLDQWKDYFNNPQGSKLGLLNAIQNIGALAAYPFAPYLSDGLGRRRTVWIGSAIMLLGVALQTAAQNLGFFIGARFLIGFGLTFATNSAPMLVTELSYPQYRPQLTSLYNSLWYSGNIVASWTTFGTEYIGSTWSWRLPSMMQGVPALFQFFLILLAPESPRWLISKGRDAEGLRTLAYYHADGDENDALVQYEYDEIKTSLELERTTSVGWKSLVATSGNRRRMLIIVAIAWFSQWSGNGLVSYYLTKVMNSIGITNTTIQLLITGILAIWNLVWAVFASFMVERVGRRRLFLTSAVGMLLFFMLQTVCTARYLIAGNAAAAHAVIAFIFLFYGFYDLAFTPLIVSYTVEILPFSVRAKGFNIFNFTISVALIFNQYVNPIALDAISWKYYIVYICWLAFELVFLWFFIVETKGLSLEETAALFDGKEATEQIHAAGVAEVHTDDVLDEKMGA
ncbi:hexose transporter [Fomitopsis serialis]|uniref:hexose transporter n=1 Tax=Fomitopsis serialis TaxID=139415 RepID=UPI0020084B46|nr:hexose transporter [Neoantrodia serialis]KAH9919814.1 hexose transporter [Neoantrodia serialis]